MAAIRLLVGIILFMGIVSSELFADKLFLKRKEEGNNVKILGEGVNSFTVEVPKDEIELIKGEDYNQVTLWREKRILWEDQGDYITIFLPKGRIVAPEELKQKEGAYYGKGQVDAFKEALASAGAEPTYNVGTGEALPVYGKGNIHGRIFDGDNPAKDCKVKIVYIKGQSDILTKLFSGSAVSEDGQMVFETKVDKDGIYEFNGVPVGSYDLYWLPSSDGAWKRKLSEKPSVTVLPGKTVQYEDINLR